MSLQAITDAPVAWRILHGVVCVYKPVGISAYGVRHMLITKIAGDLNEMKCRPARDHVFSLPGPNGQLKKFIGPSYADDPLVVGPRYLPTDVRCTWATHLGKNVSGVFVLGINRGAHRANKLHMSRPVRVYHVCGRLGIATDTYGTEGKVVEKSTYHHVKPSIIEKVLASIQAGHQKSVFEQSGVDIQSQAAYELAVQGTVRPADGKTPFLYSIKCIEFKPPAFTIEVKCINEYETYLKTLIHDIGMNLNSTAACSSVRCIRYGPFTLEHALLRRHWHLQHLLSNMILCKNIIDKSMMDELPAAIVTSNVSEQMLSAQEGESSMVPCKRADIS